MPQYLNTRGRPTLAVAICGRCSGKFPYNDLYPDPNYPGLLVCRADLDEFDPYRLPARQTENITLRFPRPDTPISTSPEGVITQDGTSFLITEDGNGYLDL